MNLLSRGALGAAFLSLAGCASQPTPPVNPQDVGAIRPGSTFLRGYLDRKLLPDSLALLPPPPAAGSAAAAADEAAYRQTRALAGTPRWQFAAQDANLHYPELMGTFACAAGMDIDAQKTPHLSMLLRRTATDAGLATYRAKDHYKRTRPFAAAGDATCYPVDDASLRGDGSYPSGHTALGWAQALVLAELMPEKADAVLARGFAYGQSRMICGAHWQSDVDMGRHIGAAALARLHADPVFQAQLRAAAVEVKAARAAGVTPRGDCAAEAAALQVR